MSLWVYEGLRKLKCSQTVLLLINHYLTYERIKDNDTLIS